MNEPQSLKGIDHLTLNQIGYSNRRMQVQAGLRLNPSVNGATEKYLLLVERVSRAERAFPFREIKTKGELSLLEAEIDVLSHPELVAEGVVWDLYISVDLEGVRRQYRLQSNNRDLELMFFYDQGLDRFLVPYTTNKGNVSLHAREKSVIAKVEHAFLAKHGILSVTGYAVYPVWESGGKEKIIKRIVFRDEDHTFEKKIDSLKVAREDLTEFYGRNFDWAGFHIDLDLNNDEWLPTGLEPLDLYIEFEDGGETVESYPLELKYSEGLYSGSAVISTQKGRRKYTFKTKKSRALSFRVSEYGYLKEAYSKVKRRILKIRKGSKSKVAYKRLFKTLGSLPPKQNLIMFESFLGKQYSCNPRAIYEYLQKHHPEYKMYWSVHSKEYTRQFAERGIPYARRFSLKWLFLMPRAKYWVFNTRMPAWIPKPKHTVYLQTWHGTPLKKLAADMEQVHMPGTNTEKYKKNFIKETKSWDYLISPNAYSSVIFWRAFQFDQELLETGYPRNDYLYNNNDRKTIEQLKENCGIPLDKKVVLYAPTWRDDQFHAKGRYKFDLDLDLQLMREKLGDDYVVILRMHYLVAENFDLTPYEGFAFDHS
ncbi:MAG TPA: CDP-glycerol glycerophosphotransferase family protein, partial [Bacillales bacterium]